VPNITELKGKIFRETHESAYSIHLEGNKRYHNFWATYWWCRIERDVAEYVVFCDTYQGVKTKHQGPIVLLQPVQVPE
jgi:hypothetical protein